MYQLVACNSSLMKKNPNALMFSIKFQAKIGPE